MHQNMTTSEASLPILVAMVGSWNYTEQYIRRNTVLGSG